MRSTRKRLMLTQEAVAEKLNITTPVLSKWENDKSVPDLAVLCKLCNAYKISISDCIKLEISENPILPPEEYNAIVLGETLKELRQRNGWSQAEVGKTLFVTSQTVSKWESGGVSSLEVLGKLAELFGVTPTQLLNGLERNKAMPEKQNTAEQPKKSNRVSLRITAIILGIIIFLGAIAGLITGLVLKYRSREEGLPNTGTPEHPEAPTFVSPVKEFFAVSKQGEDKLMWMYILDCMFFETARDTPIFAIDDGTVVIKADYIIIEHSEGFVSEYFYINKQLTDGQEVKKGQQIGTTTVEYFYINIYLDGKKVDPFKYITDLPEPITRSVNSLYLPIKS